MGEIWGRCSEVEAVDQPRLRCRVRGRQKVRVRVGLGLRLELAASPYSLPTYYLLLTTYYENLLPTAYRERAGAERARSRVLRAVRSLVITLLALALRVHVAHQKGVPG